jgi:hypothetical protein
MKLTRDMEITEPKEGERLAYDERWTVNGVEYRALAFWRDGPDARIVVRRADEVLAKTENYPAYRIYNIAAHLPDFAREHERKLEAAK